MDQIKLFLFLINLFVFQTFTSSQITNSEGDTEHYIEQQSCEGDYSFFTNHELGNEITTDTDYTENEEDYFEGGFSDEDIDDDDSDDEFEEDDLSIYANKIEMKQCPRDCICERNMHAYFVATCSRLDLETQSFANLPITDLQVIDIGPQFPIVLGVEFFKKIGLENVTFIKITNSLIKYISPSAFIGLNRLYGINLTSIGIDLIHPDTFANNTKLKILTLSGNNLNVMQSLSSPYTDYMLKSPTLEQLDISYCNMQTFLPTAFNQMKNIIYINLAGNKLETLPEGLFDKTETIKELDLSYNKIVTLPKDIFIKSSLVILYLQHNKITSNLKFVTKNIEKLDVSYNNISFINDNVLKNMKNLRYLSLKGNKLKSIDPLAFKSLNDLTSIDLSFNELEQLSSSIFLNNPVLKIIRVNDNIRLKTLPANGFEAFAVIRLDASNCGITELSEKAFHTMPLITQLLLSRNKIKEIAPEMFSPLHNLEVLDLSNNLVSNLSPTVFNENKELQMLSLANNPLNSLSTDIFKETKYLKKLDLSNCALTKLWNDSPKDDRCHEFLGFLNWLNLSNNEITTLYISDIKTMKKLKILSLENNPLEPTDEFKDFSSFLANQKIDLNKD